jgi:hypothetical protein
VKFKPHWKKGYNFMNREIAALYRLPAKQLEVVLQQLSDLRSKARGGDLPNRSTSPIPDVTLVLRSGQMLTGAVVEFAATSSAGSPILLVHLTKTANSLDTCYISLSEIAGITIHHTSETLHLLAFDHFRPLSQKVPTRLELDRQARAITEALTIPIALAWTVLPITDLSLQTLATGLQDLQTILKLILADDLGRVALQERVQRIEITCGGQGEVKFVGSTLQIVGELVNQDLRLLERSPLQTAIERLL